MSGRSIAASLRFPVTKPRGRSGAAARSVGPSLILGLILTAPVLAQVAPPQEPAGEFQELIDGIQARIEKLGKTAEESDQALDYLEQQVDEAINRLSSRLKDNAALRQKSAELTVELDLSVARRQQLESELLGVTGGQDRSVERLKARVEEQAGLITRERESAAELRESMETLWAELQATIADRDRIKRRLDQAAVADPADQERLQESLRARLGELEAASRQQAVVSEARDALETRVTELTETLGTTRQELAASATRNAELAALLEAARAADSVADGPRIETDEARLRALVERAEGAERSLEDERALARELRRKVKQLDRLRIALAEMVEASEAKTRAQEAAVTDLDRRLGEALANRVQELAKFRSEFFGRLRQVLGERPDIQIVGDRFVFQSEVLFRTGEATLEASGQRQLIRFAATLKEIAATIPPEIDWVLRVDGHTDRRPIRTPRFPSNWELSTARAISVVKFLIGRDIAPSRLVGAGFGRFHPLDPREDEIAFRRNRRIEFKLTQILPAAVDEARARSAGEGRKLESCRERKILAVSET